MELLYAVQKPKATTAANHSDIQLWALFSWIRFHENSTHEFVLLLHCNRFPGKQHKSLCAVSTQNIVAYTTDRELTESVDILPTGYYVYAADLNTPWLSYK